MDDFNSVLAWFRKKPVINTTVDPNAAVFLSRLEKVGKFIRACQSRHGSLLHLTEGDLDGRYMLDSIGNNGLHLLARSGNVNGFALLLGRGWDLAATNIVGATCLHYAARFGFVDIVKSIVGTEVGRTIIDVKAPGFDNSTALECAVSRGNLEVVNILVKHNASVNGLICGMSPLRVAVGIDSIEMAEFLLRNGAQVNSVDYIFESPLCAAVDKGSIHMVNLLLENGASINPENGEGNVMVDDPAADETFEEWLVQYKTDDDPEVVLEGDEWLYGPDGLKAHLYPYSLHKAAALIDVDEPTAVSIVDRLLKGGAKPNKLNWSNYTSLDLAARNDKPLLVALLQPPITRVPTCRLFIKEGITADTVQGWISKLNPPYGSKEYNEFLEMLYRLHKTLLLCSVNSYHTGNFKQATVFLSAFFDIHPPEYKVLDEFLMLGHCLERLPFTTNQVRVAETALGLLEEQPVLVRNERWKALFVRTHRLLASAADRLGDFDKALLHYKEIQKCTGNSDDLKRLSSTIEKAVVQRTRLSDFNKISSI